MTTSDLVSRLLEAITAKEAKAEAAKALHVSLNLARRNGKTTLDAFLNDNDPSSVLRRCAADRKLIERHGPFCDCGARRPPTNPDTGQPIPHHYDCSAYEAAQILAEAYGLEVTE